MDTVYVHCMLYVACNENKLVARYHSTTDNNNGIIGGASAATVRS